MSLRKAGKARWHYDCRLCEYTSPRAPDQLRAEEHGLRHERGAQHVGNVLTDAFEPIGKAFGAVFDAFAGMVTSAMDGLASSLEQMAEVLATPPNVPNDPRMRADKRQWGGR